VALEVHFAGAYGEVVRVVDDISLGGLRISGPIPAVAGEKVDLALRLPHLSSDVKVTGTVVWVEPSAAGDHATVGIRFEDLDPANHVMLSHIFRRGLPE